MVNPGGVGGGGGPVRPTAENLPRADTKESKSTKDTSETPKGRGPDGGGQAGGAGGVRARGRAKGKDHGGRVDRRGPGDQFTVEDEGDQRRKRGHKFFDSDEAPFTETPWSDEDAFTVSNINAEFRGQVAAGLAAARSFTKGSTAVRALQEDDEDDTGEDDVPDEDDEEVTIPRNRVKRR